MTLGLFRFEGSLWYETEVEISEESLLFTFEAVQNECCVYLDGDKIGYRYGDWNEFKVYADKLR